MLIIWFDELGTLMRADLNAREWRWHRIVANGTSLAEEGRAALQSIAQMLTSKPDDVTLLLPARECLHLTLTAPSMSARNLDLALPYLAEEHLAEPVDVTHIAPGERQGDQIAAFAVSKTLLRELLDLLAQHDIAPVAAYSDASLIDTQVDGRERGCLMLDGARMLMRGAHTSLEADCADSPVFLPALLARSSEHDEGDATMQVLCAPDCDVAPEIIEVLHSLGVKTATVALTRSPLSTLVSSGFASATNLLVGEFQASSQSTDKRQWRFPLALAASLLALVLITDVALGIIAQRQTSSLQAQAIEKLGGSMDSEKIIQLVNQEQGGGGQETSYFIDLAVALSTIVSAQDVTLKSLSYQQGSRALDVEVLVKNYDQLDLLSNEAQSAFAEADMLGATQTDDGVRARFRLSGLLQ